MLAKCDAILTVWLLGEEAGRGSAQKYPLSGHTAAGGMNLESDNRKLSELYPAPICSSSAREKADDLRIGFYERERKDSMSVRNSKQDETRGTCETISVPGIHTHTQIDAHRLPLLHSQSDS